MRTLTGSEAPATSLDPWEMEIVSDEKLEPWATLQFRHIARVRWWVCIQGDVVNVRRSGGIVPVPPNRRGTQIRQMSKKSRLRLITYMNVVDWAKFPDTKFITLTYPDALRFRDCKARSIHRYRFMRYIEESLGRQQPCLWRTEWKTRLTGKHVGKIMPHHHLMLPGAPWFTENVLREAWRKSIRWDWSYIDVDIRKVEGIDGAIKYLAKYVSKQQALGNMPYRNSSFRFGRHWGITRKGLVPKLPVLVNREMTPDEVDAMRAYGEATWPSYDRSQGTGFTLFGKQYTAWIKDFFTDSSGQPTVGSYNQDIKGRHTPSAPAMLSGTQAGCVFSQRLLY